MQEVRELQQNIDHIKQIVSSQQANARISGVLEILAADRLVEDALTLAAADLPAVMAILSMRTEAETVARRSWKNAS